MPFRDDFWLLPALANRGEPLDVAERGASEALIREAQQHLDVVFPAEYIRLMSRIDGGQPRRQALFLRNQLTGKWNYFTAEWFITMSEVMENLGPCTYDGWPSNRLIAFASVDSKDDWLCFDYRNGRQDPTIKHRDEYGKVVPVTSTFEEFANGLESNSRHDVYGVKHVTNKEAIWEAVRSVLSLECRGNESAGSHKDWSGATLFGLPPHGKARFWLGSNAWIRGYLLYPDHSECTWYIEADCDPVHSAEVDAAMRTLPFETVQIIKVDLEKWR
ncbi:MAG: SMI1/KNR4 family protein [Pirellulaceae bacterium]